MDRFTGEPGAGGYAAGYDRFRPAPPDMLAVILARMAGVALAGDTTPGLPALGTVVDLGSGTGLSTRYWAARAARVVGVEPTDAMRRQAEEAGRAFTNIAYSRAFSHETGLPYQSADIVSCSQSLHWMHPVLTFREAARVLRPRGVFAASDYDWPPATGSWEADAAYQACAERVDALAREHGVAPVVQVSDDDPEAQAEAEALAAQSLGVAPAGRRALSPAAARPSAPVLHWDKERHLDRMRRSGAFRYVREIAIHQQDAGNADRLVGLMLSQGSVNSLLKLGFHQEDIGIAQLREAAARCLGPEPRPWVWTCRVRLGIV